MQIGFESWERLRFWLFLSSPTGMYHCNCEAGDREVAMEHFPQMGGAEYIALFSAIAATFGAVSGFAFSLMSQSARTRMSRAQFFIDFTDRYNTTEMHRALVNLQVLKRTYGESLFPMFVTEFARQSELGSSIDADRRIVNRYFANIAEMRLNGLITRNTARMLLNYRGLNVFYDIVVPLNRAKYGSEPHYENVLATLKSLRKRYAYEEPPTHYLSINSSPPPTGA